MSAPSRSRFLTVAGAGLAATALPRTARAQGVKIRMAGVYSDPFGLPFFAKEAGAFAKAGFDLDVSAIVNAGAVAAAIGGGALELGVGDLISGMNALNSGVPIQLVAGGALYVSTTENNGFILGVDKNSPIHGAKDMIGKTIAVPTLVGLTTASLRAWLPANGVQLDQVKLVEFPQPAVVAALQRGTVDVALLSEPFITPNKNDVRDVGHPLDAIAKEFLATVWYANKTWMEADRERAKRVIAAIYETNRWANTHHTETFAILVRDGKLDGEKLRGMIRSVFATTLTPALIQPVLTTATNAKIFDRPIDANNVISRF
jgi:NitT/TauT family transport system substrate-binding protein